jgi:nitroreductase
MSNRSNSKCWHFQDGNRHLYGVDPKTNTLELFMHQRFDQVIDFMSTRRSVPAKTMSGPGPEEEEIRSMIAIASRVPDHGKIAPWRFQRYEYDYCKRLGELFLKCALKEEPDLPAEIQEIERTRFSRAPVVIAVMSAPRQHPKVPEWEQVLSAGAAAMSLLARTDEGVGMAVIDRATAIVDAVIFPAILAVQYTEQLFPADVFIAH